LSAKNLCGCSTSVMQRHLALFPTGCRSSEVDRWTYSRRAAILTRVRQRLPEVRHLFAEVRQKMSRPMQSFSPGISFGPGAASFARSAAFFGRGAAKDVAPRAKLFP